MKKYLLPLILILLIYIIIGHCATYTSQYPPEQSDTFVKSTTKRTLNYWAYYATDPALSVIGGSAENAWLSDGNTDQRFHIDLGSAKVIRRIYYANYHLTGGFVTRGVKNFTFWGSNTGAGSFDDLVYGNDGGWTILDVSTNTMLEHTEVDEADPQYVAVTNSTEYRYYAFKFADNYGDGSYMGVRRIELQTEDDWLPGWPHKWNTVTIGKWNTKEIMKWNDLE